MRMFFLWLILAVTITGCSKKEETSQYQPPSQSSSAASMAMAPASSEQSKALMQQAVSYLNQKDPTKAIMSLNEAIKASPNDPAPILVLAELYMRLNNYPGAIGYFEKALQLDPSNGQGFYLMGLCYGLSGNMEMAQKAVERSALIFQQKRDEANFKRSVVTLQQMMEAKTTAVSSTVAVPKVQGDGKSMSGK